MHSTGKMDIETARWRSELSRHVVVATEAISGLLIPISITRPSYSSSGLRRWGRKQWAIGSSSGSSRPSWSPSGSSVDVHD